MPAGETSRHTEVRMETLVLAIVVAAPVVAGWFKFRRERQAHARAHRPAATSLKRRLDVE